MSQNFSDLYFLEIEDCSRRKMENPVFLENVLLSGYDSRSMWPNHTGWMMDAQLDQVFMSTFIEIEVNKGTIEPKYTIHDWCKDDLK